MTLFSKKPISLRSYILSLIMVLVLSITAFLSFQSAHYLIDGFRFSHSKIMIEMAEKHLFSNAKPVMAYDYHIATRWQDVPAIIKQKVNKPTELDYLYEEFENWHYFSPPEKVYAVLKTQNPQGEVRYISRVFDSKVDLDHSKDEFWRLDPMMAILILGIMAIIIFYFIIFMAMRHITKPVESLYHWAQSLKMEDLDAQQPNFRYKELNSLASIIHHSLHSANNTLKREQEFLQYASHELRTPISVLRTNSALLDKVSPNPSEQEKIIRERLHRAGRTMKGMTETLLWLSRETEELIADEQVELDQLVMEISEDLNYLLQGKSIELSVVTSPTTLELPLEASKILLSNLIRNAFQHSVSGYINIHQQHDKVEIINTHADLGIDVNPTNNTGFGLGLKLCQKLVERFNWALSMSSDQTHHSVNIEFRC